MHHTVIAATDGDVLNALKMRSCSHECICVRNVGRGVGTEHGRASRRIIKLIHTAVARQLRLAQGCGAHVPHAAILKARKALLCSRQSLVTAIAAWSTTACDVVQAAMTTARSLWMEKHRWLQTITSVSHNINFSIHKQPTCTNLYTNGHIQILLGNRFNIVYY